MGYKIPLFNVNFDEREARAAFETIQSGWISTGPKNEQLEQIVEGGLCCQYDQLHFGSACVLHGLWPWTRR